MKCHWIGLWILYSFINVKPYKWEFWCQTIVKKKLIRTNYKFQIECRTIKQISCYMCKLVLSKRFGSFAVTINTKHTNSHKPTKHLCNWETEVSPHKRYLSKIGTILSPLDHWYGSSNSTCFLCCKQKIKLPVAC